MRYEWEPYLKYGYKKNVAKNETLFSQGEEGSGFYYVAEGKVSIRLLSEEGKERVIDYMLDGTLLGQQGIIEQPYSVSAVCDTNTCLYYFSNEAFKSICKDHPEAITIFIKVLSTRIRVLAETVTMINMPYEKQMARFLVLLSKKYNTHSIPITQIALAQYIGTSRITVYKIMQKWAGKNVISIGKNKIDIINFNKLTALIG